MRRELRIRSVALAAVGVLVLSCSDAFIEPNKVESTEVDDKLSLTGRVCTQPPDPTGFPVKVVFIVDQSGSMCVSDPPGSQGGQGFCQQPAILQLGQGIAEPARVRALRALTAQLGQQPNVQVAVVPFETNVKNPWPAQTGGIRFARPDSTLDSHISSLQAQLGKGTDYQGALSYAYTTIASDIVATNAANPQLLPRTRYVVVFLTDGTPYPRCSANDDLTQYADPNSPWLTWADSSSAEEFCNLLDEDQRQQIYQGDNIPSFPPGTDRNQNYQLFSYVDQLMELKDQYNIGDIRLHSVLLFNEFAVQQCGAICQDIYGTYPNVPAGQYPAEAKKIARWTLEQLAARGNGIYQEFNNGDIQQLSLGALDYSSLASQNVMKTIMLQSLTSVPSEEKRIVDSDGDGLPDDFDNTFSHGTNSFTADSDGDCFDDQFEIRRATEGFLAGNDKDTRGCDPNSPASLDCTCQDTDGDLLSQYAEAYLKTRGGLVDSDGDGVPDGLEARYGLNPLFRAEAGLDTDGDGITDYDEFRAGSDPTRQDTAFFEKYGYQYEVTSETMTDGSICYDFTISNVQMVTPPPRAGQRQGYNLFRVWFAQAPESGVATDYGEWSSACAWAQYNPPKLREPLGPEISFVSDHFVQADFFDRPDVYLGSHPSRTNDPLCVGNQP